MATTVNEVTSHVDGGVSFLHLKLTAGAADTSVTYTIAGAPQIKALTQPFKTTGSTQDMLAVYDAATGIITVSQLGNNDVIRLTVVV